jgi:putative transposase
VARFARENTPGALTHIVSRFAPGCVGFRREDERESYLSRVDAALLDSDWQLLAYALMPDRIHWLAIAGETPLSRFIKPLHVGFALWLNRNQRHAGPVFAERPRTLESDLSDTLDLITYIHNTPVREGHAAEASESRWTSHRAYLGVDPTPGWLRTERGLGLCDMPADADGRQRFSDYVAGQLGRADLMVRPSGAVRSALIERAIYAPRRWDGPIDEVLDGVNTVSGIEPDRIRSSDRSREVVGARRVAILAGTRFLGRTLTEMAQVVGISTSSASRLVRTDPDKLNRAAAEAERVAEILIARANAAAAAEPTANTAAIRALADRQR